MPNLRGYLFETSIKRKSSCERNSIILQHWLIYKSCSRRRSLRTGLTTAHLERNHHHSINHYSHSYKDGGVIPEEEEDARSCSAALVCSSRARSARSAASRSAVLMFAPDTATGGIDIVVVVDDAPSGGVAIIIIWLD